MIWNYPGYAKCAEALGLVEWEEGGHRMILDSFDEFGAERARLVEGEWHAWGAIGGFEAECVRERQAREWLEKRNVNVVYDPMVYDDGGRTHTEAKWTAWRVDPESNQGECIASGDSHAEAQAEAMLAMLEGEK